MKETTYDFEHGNETYFCTINTYAVVANMITTLVSPAAKNGFKSVISISVSRKHLQTFN